MRSWQRLLTLLPLMVLQAVAISSSHAAGQKDACLENRACRHHVQRARSLSDGGRFADALGAYQAAYEVRPRPWLLFNMARILDKLNRRADASEHYQRYLDVSGAEDTEQARIASAYLAQAQPSQPAATGEVAPVSEVSPPRVDLSLPPSALRPEPPLYKNGAVWAAIGVLGLVVGIGIVGAVVATQRDTASPTAAIPPGWIVFMPFK